MSPARTPTAKIRSIRLAVCLGLTPLLVVIAAVALSACGHDARGARTSQPGDVDHVAKLLQQRLTDAGVRASVTAAVAAGDDRIAIDASPDGGTGPALDALSPRAGCDLRLGSARHRAARHTSTGRCERHRRARRRCRRLSDAL